MAIGTKALRPLAVAALVLMLAAATLVALPETGGDPPPDPVELEAAIEEIVSGTAEETAEANAEDPDLVAMATPCLMRRPRLAEGLDQGWRHAFAAATLATRPDQRSALLLDLSASAPNDIARWRVDIAMVELALRSGEHAAATRHLGAASGRDVPISCRADEAYFAAALALHPAAAAALLDEAVAMDPGFWAALETLAVVSATGTGRDVAACERDAVRTLETVVQLGALARRDTQFQRLNRALEGMAPSGRRALLRGMILRQTGQPGAARAAYAEGLAALGTSPCDAILRQGLEGMLAATEDDT